ncbi:AP-1 complex-associated regulatory protein isoform X1 [Lethenteron reissneri]|uniref:AP-1 complex-associated regulatory protein isoform X1 n=1 Tax=Lethenteron reissneri TaxID=7753 RepID=UPI002AB71B3A|nr:AP-1 complex-associated regulatory protein isoform X1 [Lethenteron reissneri]
MGACWSWCVAALRPGGAAGRPRLSRAGGGGSKYFKSGYAAEHTTIEFENLVEEDEVYSSVNSNPRMLTEEEVRTLREGKYEHLVEDQRNLDQRLAQQLREQEERLKKEEEALHRAQRLAALHAKQKHARQERSSELDKSWVGDSADEWQVADEEEDFDNYLQGVKARSDAFRNKYRIVADAAITPNTESSRTRSSADDSASLDLEWEDEEGINRMLEAHERSRTEEDLLQASMMQPESPRPPGRARSDREQQQQEQQQQQQRQRQQQQQQQQQGDSGGNGSTPAATSTTESSPGLEWENDFVGAQVDDNGNDDGGSSVPAAAGSTDGSTSGDDRHAADR